jgi:hypothetical protein
MDNNQAYAYKLDDKYISIYVNLNGYDQIIFYWCLQTNTEKRLPKWRETKETIETGTNVISYSSYGCIVEVEGRRAEFNWYDYNNPNNNPAHKGKLINFGEWEFDPEFKFNSPSSQGIHYTGYASGYYASPQTYEEDKE